MQCWHRTSPTRKLLLPGNDILTFMSCKTTTIFQKMVHHILSVFGPTDHATSYSVTVWSVTASLRYSNCCPRRCQPFWSTRIVTLTSCPPPIASLFTSGSFRSTSRIILSPLFTRSYHPFWNHCRWCYVWTLEWTSYANFVQVVFKLVRLWNVQLRAWINSKNDEGYIRSFLNRVWGHLCLVAYLFFSASDSSWSALRLSVVMSIMSRIITDVESLSVFMIILFLEDLIADVRTR